MKPSVLRSAASLQQAWRRRGGPLGRFVARLDKLGIPYLSHSKLACVERCPCCYYHEYVLGERLDFPALTLGSLFHLATKRFYTQLGRGPIPKAATLLDRGDLKRVHRDSVPELKNALVLLRDHHWEGHTVVSVELPFFLDLAEGLPPIIGVPDLVLQRHDSLVVVDHKTSRTFNDCDPAQLVLYAEHLRRVHAHDRIVGVFDEYRLVRDLATIRKPAFRRTPVSVDRSLLIPLIQRYREAWCIIRDLGDAEAPPASADCWVCGRRGPW